MIIKWNNAVILLMVLILLCSCSQSPGTFAYKKADDDRYLSKKGLWEFKQDEIIDWTFYCNKPSKNKKLGISILKKEIVWIDVHSFYNIISTQNPSVYGRIQNYDQGEYKIIVSENDVVIGQQKFVIYNDELE